MTNSKNVNYLKLKNFDEPITDFIFTSDVNYNTIK